MYAKILVPVDGSNTANQALDEAIKLAKTLNSTIEVLHVIDNSHLLYDTGISAAADVHGTVIDAGKTILEQAKLRVTSAGLHGETRMVDDLVAPGDIAGSILKAARDSQAELVVIGSHGRTGFRKLVLGSVAEKVMHQCPLPVWIIRGKEA